MDKNLKITIIIGILVVSFSLLWFVYEYSQNKEHSRSFSVIGEGKEIVVPNIAVLRIGVVTKGSDLKVVQKENSEKINKIIDFLKNQGIDEKDIQTENYLVSPEYNYKENPYKIVGYSINQELKVKVRDLVKVGDILQNAVNYGANTVNGPNFEVDDQNIYLEKAREKAILDAKEKAEKIAKTAGFRLGKIVIIEDFSMPPPIYSFKGGAVPEMLSTSPQIQPDSQEIKIQVQIIYEIK